ncbi:TrkH family potassium uptake protein [Selenihalanaerobacter shriftii]|uniref:Trk system potassium uptake protein TrkH n=1 Tax=Selenihalanaerobacter shriftii TaxID=142842 RepID=A0A1T4QWM6_9FIRM|nr:TrkH family potassium uptake protein [Selenihalanaerobacter shriftii]SKA08153.1 trk system potassium uptake protein TrkH [Selenihalanaerobacter shriftii]
MRYKRLLKERYKLLIKYIGALTIGIGTFLLLPLLILFFYPEEIVYLTDFLIPSVISLIVGFLAWKLIPYEKKVTLSLKEGGIIVLISWIIAIGASAAPFVIAGDLNITQAVFEATSGWTTTGLSVVDVTKAPHVFLLWRSIMQFFGGVGLVVVMLSSVLHPYGFGLYNAEGRSDKLLPHVKRSTKAIMLIYLGYITGGVLLYILIGMTPFDAINHSIAALSTGGFSTKVNSIGHWNSLPMELITIILMILGTINFATHFTLLRGKIKTFFRNGEIRLLFFLIALFAPIVTYFSMTEIYSSLPTAFRRGIFEVVSALSTTGYSLDVFTNWNQFGVLALVLLMWIGGGTGSTAGGIKLYRIYLMFKSFIWQLKTYFLPENVIVDNYIWHGDSKAYIKEKYIRQIANYIFIYMVTYFIGVLIYLAHGYSLSKAMFEFASSLGTVGLSIGITGPDAPVTILWTEIIGMFLGRLEFFVIFFAIAKLFKDMKVLSKNN